MSMMPVFTNGSDWYAYEHDRWLRAGGPASGLPEPHPDDWNHPIQAIPTGMQDAWRAELDPNDVRNRPYEFTPPFLTGAGPKRGVYTPDYGSEWYRRPLPRFEGQPMPTDVQRPTPRTSSVPMLSPSSPSPRDEWRNRGVVDHGPTPVGTRMSDLRVLWG